MRLHGREQRAPHAQPRYCVIGFGLREQSLRFRHLDDAGEPVLIASARSRARTTSTAACSARAAGCVLKSDASIVNCGTAASAPGTNTTGVPAEPIASAKDARAISAICTA